jgi:hypothetical protein
MHVSYAHLHLVEKNENDPWPAIRVTSETIVDKKVVLRIGMQSLEQAKVSGSLC